MSTDKTATVALKKETIGIAAIIIFAAGFLAGVVFGVYQSEPTVKVIDNSRSRIPAGMANLSPDQARTILALEKEVAANPDNVEAWTRLGHIYFDTNMVKKAIHAYEKSLELNPADPNVWTDLGVMYRRNGEPSRALDAFNHAIKLNPRHEQSHFNKGIVLLYDMKDKKAAREAWEELLRINPAAMAPNGQSVRQLLDTVIGTADAGKSS